MNDLQLDQARPATLHCNLCRSLLVDVNDDILMLLMMALKVYRREPERV